MSTTPNIPAETPAPLFPGADVPRRPRHALGLPAGSIRAILALMVAGLFCVLILVSPLKEKVIPIPPYLIYLLFMILGHFFAAHGVTISRAGVEQPAPLYLPRGFVRLLLIVMIGGTIGWEIYQNFDVFQKQLEASVKSIQDQAFMPVILLGGFFLGVIAHVLVGKQHPPFWFQDFEAWVALIAVLGLCIEGIFHLVINWNLPDPVDPVTLQAFIAGFVAFYFGARS